MTCYRHPRGDDITGEGEILQSPISWSRSFVSLLESLILDFYIYFSLSTQFCSSVTTQDDQLAENGSGHPREGLGDIESMLFVQY